MRTGLWLSGAGGSGILIARLPDGSWSPPSGILLHTAGLGFLVGVDIYDCVVVINDEKALEAFTKVRCTLGGEVSAVAGPVGMGGVLESEVHKRQAPIFTYLKSRGFYAGVQVDGTIIIERTDENERFYGQKIPVADILAGKARHPPREIKMLMDTVRAAEGQMVDDELLPHEAPPGDYELEESEDGPVFGIPDKEDPDPYGFLALQQQGLDVREASTKERASADEFDFRPSPTSPVHNAYRRSTDSRDLIASRGESRRNSWRASALSNASRMTDSATQTDNEDMEQRSPFSATFPNGISRSPAGSVSHRSMDSIPEGPHPVLGQHPPALPPRNKHQSVQSMSPSLAPVEEPTKTDAHTKADLPSNSDKHHDNDDDKLDDEDEDEDDFADVEDDAVVHDVQVASTPLSPAVSVQTISKPKLVTVHKVAPPKLPPRNPIRGRQRLDADGAPVSPVSATSASSIGTGADKSVPAAEQSSEAESGRTVDSLSSFETEAKKDTSVEKEDDGFTEVQLGAPESEAKKQVSDEHTPTPAEKRDSGAMRLFAERMRLDDDDDDLVKQTPGGW